MEKLVYLLWKPVSQDHADFEQALLGPVSKDLVAQGSRGLHVNVVEPALAEARLTRQTPPLDGLASFWLPCADDRGPLEAVLRAATSRLAGYAVLESSVLPHAAGPGRGAGIDVVALLERPEAMTREAWLDRWFVHHRAVALETQATFLYVRNVVVRALTEGAPPYEGIVEEGFAEDAVLDKQKWYDAEGDPERMRAHLGRMVASCKTFLELDRVESHPTRLHRIQD